LRFLVVSIDGTLRGRRSVEEEQGRVKVARARAIDTPQAQGYTAGVSGAYLVRPVRHTLPEAGALLAVERKSLGDSPYAAREILKVLRRPEHYAYVACLGSMVVGFCSSFETASDQGSRLELDMLGVLPAHRHRGLGTALVRTSMGEALRRGVREFRAVVAVDNVASHLVFVGAGLATLPHRFDMMIYEISGRRPLGFLPEGWSLHAGGLGRPEPASDGLASGRETHTLKDQAGAIAAMAQCLQVHTLAYRGMWLEKLWGASKRATRLAARAVVERAKVLGLDEIGYLAPSRGDADDQASNSAALLGEGYKRVGSYHVFKARRA